MMDVPIPVSPERLRASMKKLALCSVCISWKDRSSMTQAVMQARHTCMSLGLYLEVDNRLTVEAVVQGVAWAIPFYYDESGHLRPNVLGVEQKPRA